MARHCLPSSSSDEGSSAPPVKKRQHCSPDVTPDKTELGARGRRPSSKQAAIDKENVDTLKAKIDKMQKKLVKQTKVLAADTTSKNARDEDNGLESEEGMSGADDLISFPSTITPLGPLLSSSAAHYLQDTASHQGFGENKIITSVQRLTTFRDSDSVGILFPSLFNPITLPHVALNFTVVDFCCDEWSTGLIV
ncbi:hypothetical protein C8R46DRAFT_1206671 [Mycena filopes]|nr:hypothetical protein C8R46DRAFT_1206671 [Mycena filopes]